MKKTLLLMLVALGALTAAARPDDAPADNGVNAVPEQGQEAPSAQDSNVGMLDVLDQVQGYVFLSKDETRNLTELYAASNAIDVDKDQAKVLTWEAAKPDIAQIHPEDGTITGHNYGNTLVTAQGHIDGKNVELHVVVFVCPRVTILSPEGAIYTYQKVYDYPAKIYFSQSNEYLLNCVMLEYTDAETGQRMVKDITYEVDVDRDENGAPVNKAGTDGYYISDPVIDDITLTVSMESRQENEAGLVVGNSGINVRVVGHQVTFHVVGSDTEEVGDAAQGNNDSQTLIDLTDKNVVITDIHGRKVFNEPMPENRTINFVKGAEGVFFVSIDDIDGDFKIIVH